MRKKLIWGSVLALTLTLTSPVAAAEEKPFQLPSIDVVEWVFGLLEIFEMELSGEEIGPNGEPNGRENPPAAEMGPGAEPNGESTGEMGPAIEPIG